ncbi:MAG: hypothetical protein GWO20_17120 [Candidatus Korarchaeota archaeon]|nr:hypothetical protein [Candidatus Korarchaeota archaeon]NIU85580.1 hypothetical protein [Candidatus Thorarchaeota archaeon]NIW15124.1 hypothetical protein [Candidatus Thorarchaeota archaeon]NIW53129.1 hypothetical protein [Candidatus Korarchaeota archaeon]
MLLEDIQSFVFPTSFKLHGKRNEVFAAIEAVEQAMVDAGAKRVVTSINIDDCVDRLGRTRTEKVDSVREKLEP